MGDVWTCFPKLSRPSKLLKPTNEGRRLEVKGVDFARTEDAAKAHHFIQDRRNIGKVLLVP